MAWGFKIGERYSRKADFHTKFGGQEQGGIITPRRFPLVAAITGDKGKQHGYFDRWRDDGVFEYFGAGQIDDMQMTDRNLRLRNHVADRKSLLLFSDVVGGLIYEGEFVCDDHHIELAPDKNGKERDAIVFHLRPIESATTVFAELPIEHAVSLADRRKRAFDAAEPNPKKRQVKGSIFERSRRIRDYVVSRSQGRCEHCRKNAPFERPGGAPYLEAHHIHNLSDNGPDDPIYVAAVCPNCHREAHFGVHKAKVDTTLLAWVEKIEASWDGNSHAALA